MSKPCKINEYVCTNLETRSLHKIIKNPRNLASMLKKLGKSS